MLLPVGKESFVAMQHLDIFRDIMTAKLPFRPSHAAKIVLNEGHYRKGPIEITLAAEDVLES
jgi:hypothetical protein